MWPFFYKNGPMTGQFAAHLKQRKMIMVPVRLAATYSELE